MLTSRKAEVLDELCVWAPGNIKKDNEYFKVFLEAVPQCIPLVTLLTRLKFMREPHLSGDYTLFP